MLVSYFYYISCAHCACDLCTIRLLTPITLFCVAGDRIHVSNSESEVSPDGSSGWIVEKVDLFSTSVCFGTTNERATVSNGTLASSRIINAARSPNAVVYVNLKVSYTVMVG